MEKVKKFLKRFSWVVTVYNVAQPFLPPISLPYSIVGSAISAVTVALLHGFVKHVRDLSGSWESILWLGLAVMGFCLVWLIAPLATRLRRWLAGAPETSDRQPLRTGSKANKGVTLIPSRKALPAITNTLSNHKTVWALWQTAAQADNTNAWELGRIRRLILMHPDGDQIVTYAPAFSRTPQELAEVIRGATTRAQAGGVEVRWFDGPIPMNLTIFDPDLPEAKARVELILPFAGTDARPSLEIPRTSPLYGRFVELFENTWKAAGSDKNAQRGGLHAFAEDQNQNPTKYIWAILRPINLTGVGSRPGDRDFFDVRLRLVSGLFKPLIFIRIRAEIKMNSAPKG